MGKSFILIGALSIKDDGDGSRLTDQWWLVDDCDAYIYIYKHIYLFMIYIVVVIL